MNATDSILALVRPDILALTPYSSARKESSGGRVWLDANENPKTPSAFLPSAASAKAGCDQLNRYPEPQPRELVAQLAALYGVAPSQLLVTRGSDEGIDLLLRTFCRADRDAIVVTPPTYGMYAVAAGLQGARVVPVSLIREKNFSLDAAAVLAAFSSTVGAALCRDGGEKSRRKAAPTIDPATRGAIKLVFLCSPNNPTGALLDRAAVLSLVRALADRAVVVVDEAYVDFTAEPSFATLIAANPNLVVLRTLSKAYGLAGARVGTTIADPALIAVLQKVIAPYPVPAPVAHAALAALTPAAQRAARESVRELVTERARLAAALPKLAAVRRVWPSDANFLLVEVTDSARVMSAARAAGLIIRDRSKDVPNSVRITIGTPAENNLVLEVLSHA